MKFNRNLQNLLKLLPPAVGALPSPATDLDDERVQSIVHALDSTMIWTELKSEQVSGVTTAFGSAPEPGFMRYVPYAQCSTSTAGGVDVNIYVRDSTATLQVAITTSGTLSTGRPKAHLSPILLPPGWQLISRDSAGGIPTVFLEYHYIDLELGQRLWTPRG